LSKGLRIALGIMVALLALVLIGPFLVPVARLRDTVPVEALADADSRFAELNGLTVHFKQAGQGEPNLVLLHGFGASVFSWREVLEPLAQSATVAAFDRPAFGLTERPLSGSWGERNPYAPEAQAELTIALMDHLGMRQAVLVGHSAGGGIAMLTALRYPERVQALILVDPAVYTGGGAPAWVLPLLRTPQMRRIGPLVVRSIRDRGEAFLRTAWHDPSTITPDIWEGYIKPLSAHDWDRALWELTLASHPLNLPAQLDAIRIPVLVITGDDDRVVPTSESIRLAGELPDAQLEVIANCGHVPHEERPDVFLAAARRFLADIAP
jgi:pimeloyl-ACP methyl ester carboxylesterase